MQVSQKCIDLVKRYEGFISKAYLCPAGVISIGWGHTGSDVKKGMIITKEEAENLLKKDLKKFEQGLCKMLNAEELNVTQNQFDALISFAYNLGLSTLAGSTLWRLFTHGDIQGAADEFTKWIYAGGKPLEGLKRRRQAERELFLKH